MNDDNENKILDLVSKLDFSKAVYNEYDLEKETNTLGAVVKHTYTAVFDFEKEIKNKRLTIEMKVNYINKFVCIRKINNTNVDVWVDFGKYLDMAFESRRGMTAKGVKILEDYLNS